MKWSLQQLQKISNFPYKFNEILDLSEQVKSVSDIYEIKPVEVTGEINRIDEDTYRFVYRIKVILVLQCALTLDPIEYDFDNTYDEIYSTIPNDDYYLVEKNTIDTSVMVLSNILIDKPINVTKPDAYEILKQRGINLDDAYIEEDDDPIISYSDGYNDPEDER